MNRAQAPQQEQYCEADWNGVSTIDKEAYWVSKVRAVCVRARWSQMGTWRCAARVCPVTCGLRRERTHIVASTTRSTCTRGTPQTQVEAERLAWKLADELGLDVVTILPNFVLVRGTAGRAQARCCWAGCRTRTLHSLLMQPPQACPPPPSKHTHTHTLQPTPRAPR
jgi:hypothetical protein